MVSRRTCLRLGSAALLGLAGCTAPGGSDGDGTSTPTDDPTPTPTDVPTGERSETDERRTGQSPTGEPGDVTVEGADPAWTRALGAPLRGGPAYVDGRVVVAAGERVYALDAATGETAWTLDPPAVPERDHERLDATFRAHDGVLYTLLGVSFGTGASDYSLHALTPAGEERWRYTSDVNGLHTLVGFGGGRAVLATGDDAVSGRPSHTVFAVGLTSGERRWTGESGDVTGGAVGPGLATVETYGAVDGFDVESGEHRFRFAPASETRIHDSAVGDGSAYVAASVGEDATPNVVALDPRSGAPVWQGVESAVTSLRYLDALYAGGDSVVRVGADGEERWRYDGGGPLTDVPFDDEALYTNAGSRVVAVGREDGEERWSTDAPDRLLPRLRSGDAVVSHAGKLRRVFVHDAADGTERWRAHVPGGYTHGPTAGDGGAYLVTSDATVVRVPL